MVVLARSHWRSVVGGRTVIVFFGQYCSYESFNKRFLGIVHGENFCCSLKIWRANVPVGAGLREFLRNRMWVMDQVGQRLEWLHRVPSGPLLFVPFRSPLWCGVTRK